MKKCKPFSINKQFYSLASTDGQTAEVVMYGDVVEERPVDFWTGQPIEGNFIMLDEFLDDMETLSKCKKACFRINSYGGDSAVGITIHNKIRELSRKGVETECIIDGVAMSAATAIMSACDNVIANPSSLIMIHKCWSMYWGAYNADDLREMANSHDAYDKAYATNYARKTGLGEEELLSMMSETTYMTGKEAMEKGFVDSLTEDDVKLAASADGRTIFAGKREIHLCPGMFAPDNIPTVIPEENTSEVIDNKPDSQAEEEEKLMNLTELKEQYPELVSELTEEVLATVNHDEAVNSAVKAEQKRMAEIDEVASLFDAELVADCKYGENPCSAADLAYRAALNAKKQGEAFMKAVKDDSVESNADEVEPVSAPVETVEPKSESQIVAETKAIVKDLLK